MTSTCPPSCGPWPPPRRMEGFRRRWWNTCSSSSGPSESSRQCECSNPGESCPLISAGSATGTAKWGPKSVPLWSSRRWKQPSKPTSSWSQSLRAGKAWKLSWLAWSHPKRNHPKRRIRTKNPPRASTWISPSTGESRSCSTWGTSLPPTAPPTLRVIRHPLWLAGDMPFPTSSALPATRISFWAPMPPRAPVLGAAPWLSAKGSPENPHWPKKAGRTQAPVLRSSANARTTPRTAASLPLAAPGFAGAVKPRWGRRRRALERVPCSLGRCRLQMGYLWGYWGCPEALTTPEGSMVDTRGAGPVYKYLLILIPAPLNIAFVFKVLTNTWHDIERN